MAAPKVSILCLTYNQANFVRQMLDSLLMQKTNFDFEILINDDASDDGTKEILKEYEKKYPDIIKLNLQKENLYSQGIRGMVVRFLLPKARGKYIALCEGDDYWTDPKKLQLQVNFLEKNSEYALCFHPVRVFYENGEEQEYIYPEDKKASSFTVEELLKRNYIQTNSVMYRKRETYNSMPTNIMPGDWYLHLYHAQYGKIGFINKVMADYRKHAGGIWWNTYANKDEFWIKQSLAHMALYDELLKLYGSSSEYKAILHQNITNLLTSLIDVDTRKQGKLLKTVLGTFPFIAESYIASIIKQNQELKNILVKLEAENKNLKEQIKHLAIVVADREHRLASKTNEADEYLYQLNAIRNSRTWRYVQKAATLKTAVKKIKKIKK